MLSNACSSYKGFYAEFKLDFRHLGQLASYPTDPIDTKAMKVCFNVLADGPKDDAFKSQDIFVTDLLTNYTWPCDFSTDYTGKSC